MFLPTLIFSGQNWLVPAGLFLGLGLLLLFWSYRSTSAVGGIRWICLALKLVGLAALALCLLEPMWAGQRARPGANLMAIVADNSMGLQIKDRGQSRSRGEELVDLLNPQTRSWQSTLAENFELRRYFFDARLESTPDFGELKFDGRASAIGGALRTIAERYHNRPLAGVLLLTDGNATDLPAMPDLAGLPPIFPVVLGDQGPSKDIALQQANVSQTDFEDAPVTIQVEAAAAGYNGETVVAQLTEATGKKVEETSAVAQANDALAFHFRFRPAKSGLSFYRLNLRTKSELNGAAGAPTQEATLANNGRVLSVDRGHGPYRILYVSGRPNWEFKFLNRAAQEDDQLQLVGLIRVAKREPKFAFRGRAGESSNPLFRGFGNQSAEQVESYDQPVLVRLNTKDNFELRAGFPSTPEELYGYRAVILDDLEAAFFTPQQAALLQKYVSERGGGLLMLGGMESFQEGEYARTPIGEMLPVYLGQPDVGTPGEQFHLNLTREGWLQPWARLRDNEGEEKARLETMPSFLVLNHVREAKPGATVVATVADSSGKVYPALVSQRFGRGRTAALMVGDVWHWGLHDAESHHDMDKAWRQMLRWLITDVPNEVDLTVEPQPADAAGAVQLQVRARDEKFQPLDNASVMVEVQPVMTEGTGATNAIRLRTESSPNEAGLYQVTFVPHLTGGYRASAYVTNNAGMEVGRAEAGWSTDLAADEFRSLSPNVALLENLAKKTGGEVIPASKLESFAKSLPHRHAPVMEAWTYPLWHTPVMFGFALACLVAEWGLRRWKGMP